MAKENSIISLRGTFENMTHVQSKTYGKHVRAARGTHKPAVINAAFKKAASEMSLSNLPAKLIKDALEPFRKDFKGGLLWQKLVSLFMMQYKVSGGFNFSELQNWEIHKEYPLSRLLRFSSITSEIDVANGTAILKVCYHEYPDFKRKYIDGYRITVLAIYPMLKDKVAVTEVDYDRIRLLNEEHSPVVSRFNIPDGAEVVIFCIKLEGYDKGIVDNSPATKGMQIVRVDEIKQN